MTDTFRIYIFYFLLGGTLFCLLKYFSNHNNTLVCSIIPALPVLFLAGLFFIYKNKGDIKLYSVLSIKTILIYIVFLFVFVLLLKVLNHFTMALILSLLFFILFYVLCFYNHFF